MRLIDADELIEHVWRDKLDSRELIAEMIEKAPTIKEIPTSIPIDVFEKLISQEPKIGRWMNKDHLFESCSAECSSCHKRSNGYVHDNGFSLEFKYFDFCPNCGAKMVEPQESEGY